MSVCVGHVQRDRPWATIGALVTAGEALARDPSLALSFLFGQMTTIRLKENEPFEVALRRFKRTIEKNGLIPELRAREFYEKPTAERKRKRDAAVKRTFKRLRSQLLPKKLY